MTGVQVSLDAWLGSIPFLGGTLPDFGECDAHCLFGGLGALDSR